MVHPMAQRILQVVSFEAERRFVGYLFSFLPWPLGSVFSVLLPNHSLVETLVNFYRSNIRDLYQTFLHSTSSIFRVLVFYRRRPPGEAGAGESRC
ncbi:hypothetical protein LINPERPRIM_LOCUS37735 [Linum perenne]